MRLLRFTALWCADCIVMKQKWKTALANHSQVLIEDYDFDDNEDLVKKYRVKNLPQLILLDKNEAEISRQIGMQNQEDIEKIFNEYLRKINEV